MFRTIHGSDDQVFSRMRSAHSNHFSRQLNLLSIVRLTTWIVVWIAASIDLRAQLEINVPPGSVPMVVDTGTTVNVLDTAVVKNGFQVAANGVVNIRGGTTEVDFYIAPDGTVNMMGGNAMQGPYVDGGRFEISGGTLGDHLIVNPGSQLHVYGFDFRMNGLPITGLEDIGDTRSDIDPFGVMSGILQDGTPFAFSLLSFHYPHYDEIGFDSLTLHRSAIPPTGAVEIIASTDEIPLGIRNGQSLIVDSTGSVPTNFNAGPGSAVIVQQGGVVGDNFEAVGAVVNVNGGAVGERFEVHYGTVANVSAGTIGDHLSILRGGEMNIRGGVVGRWLESSGTLNVYGGSFGEGFDPSGSVNIHGSDFRVNGEPVDGLSRVGDQVTIMMPHTDYNADEPQMCDFNLTGVFEDGSPFSFSSSDYDLVNSSDFFPPPCGGQLTLHRSSMPGDFDDNGLIDVSDLDALTFAVRVGAPDSVFDLNNDGLVDVDDRIRWVHDLKQTWFGDANLDGEFNSTDLSAVLAAGQYEDDVEFNSSWATGDFNADGDFDSSDLSFALADGGYEQGPRLATAAVPEPSSVVLLCIGVLAFVGRRR